MARHQLDKATASLLVEAVRSAVGHLSRARLAPEALQPTDERRLVQVYGRARRVLAYLQHATQTYAGRVAVEFDDADQDFLASCALLEIGIASEAVGAPNLPESRHAYLLRARSTLERLVREFATGPLASIPGDPNASSPRVRALVREIGERFGAASTPPDLLFGTTPAGLFDHPEPTTPQSAAAAAPDVATETGPAAASNGRLRLPRQVVDPRRIRHPHLRALAGLDQQAWVRSVSGHDLRAAAVHLRAMLEAVTVDQALRRSAELGLQGDPASWEPELLIRRLVPDLGDGDRRRLRFLLRCDELVRPSTQLDTPLPMNPQILAELSQSVLQVFVAFGVRGEAERGPA